MQKTILVVEDEFLIAMDLQATLEGNGWRVLGPAACVKDALGLLEDELPSVALLDVNLGRELVTPVAAMLREHNVPFAVSSAYQSPERIAGACLAGAVNVGKPAGDRHLLATLADLVKN